MVTKWQTPMLFRAFACEKTPRISQQMLLYFYTGDPEMGAV